MINRGYIVEFKRKGLLPAILSKILRLFERDWDGWGWHLAIVWEESKLSDGWYILEALINGVEINYYSNEYLSDNARIYKWLEKAPTKKALARFLQSHITRKYDVGIYIWTTLQYLMRHYFNRKIPRLLDERYTCWELVFEFCEEMGKPISSKYDCPLVTDFLKAITTNNNE